MSHSNQVREFRLTNQGVDLLDVYVGPGGVLTGTARASREAKEEAEAIRRKQKIEQKLREIERRRKVREAQIAALQAESEAEEEEAKRISSEEKMRETALAEYREEMARLRKADISSKVEA
jgi:circadian clock protein KaiC